MKNKKTSLTKQVDEMATNGRFSKPTKHFTQISNQVLRDDTLSLRAKGLFALIASYITLPNFTLYKKYIHAQCSEGRYAFDSAWKELQDAGYLVHQRVRTENGTFGYEYSLSLLDEQLDKKEKFYIDATKQDHLHTVMVEREVFELPKKSVSVAEQPLSENQPPVVLYSTKKTVSNNTKSVFRKHRQMIEKQIEWHYFENDPSFAGPPVQAIDILVDYLAEQSSLASEGNGLLSQVQIEGVDSCSICEFLKHMEQRAPRRIRNPKAYWTTAFGNYVREQAFSLLYP